MDENMSICFMCRRSEKEAGPMLHLPGGICVCNQCMQSTVDMAEKFNIIKGPNSGVQFSFAVDNDGNIVPNSEKMQSVTLDSDGNPIADGKSTDEGGKRINHKNAENESGNEVEIGSNDAEIVDSDDEDADSDSDKENENDEKKAPKYGDRGFPNISFLNMSDILGNFGMPGRQQPKKRKKPLEPIDLKKILPPHKIKEQLDEFVVGQEQAKKIISVAVYNHYKRVATGTMDDIEIEKSNILMIGPTGCGKTYLVKTLAKLLDVPLAIADATSLTEAGYIGDDIESVVSKLLAAADNDVERAERGIIFIDEIDKIAKKKETTSRDVSGESVQQGLLKLLEGSTVEVPVGANSKNAMVPLATVNTRNILFICGGAFPDLEEVIKQRLHKETSIGYSAELKDKTNKEKNILSKVRVEDIKKFGMIPEFVGRLPVICPMEMLDKDMMVSILKEPKNAILKQYQKLLELDEVKLNFDDEALAAIAERAMERDTGARALRAIIEEFMLDIMYEIPKDKNIGEVTITREYIEGIGGPKIEMRRIAVPVAETAVLDASTKEN